MEKFETPVAGAATAAIIGAGLMGRWHARYAQRAGAQVVAVVDRDAAAARQLAKFFRRCAAFTTPDEMLAGVKPAAVHICVPAESHYSVANRCMDAGPHLLVEKPLTPAAAETDLLLRRAAAKGVLLCPVHQYLFQDGVLRAADLLPRLGAVMEVRATFCSAGGRDLSGMALDAIAGDILPHPLSLIGRLFEDGLSAGPFCAKRLAAGELRVFWTRGDTAFSIAVSMNGRPACARLEIIGAGGTLHLDLFHGYALIESGRVSRLRKVSHPFDLGARILARASANMARRVVTWEPAYPGLRTLVRAFYSAVRTGGASPVSPREVLEVARTRDRILDAVAAPQPR